MEATPREVERKFVLDGLPDEAEGTRGRSIRQGYVVVTDRGTELRVRREGKQERLTVKEGEGLSRGEHERKLTAGQFEALWPLTRGRRIKKVRYEVPCGGYTAEVDVYRGKLKGLTTAEIEFPDEAAARAFQPPEWLGREVTDDEHYRNRNLAEHGLPQEAGR